MGVYPKHIKKSVCSNCGDYGYPIPTRHGYPTSYRGYVTNHDLGSTFSFILWSGLKF